MRKLAFGVVSHDKLQTSDACQTLGISDMATVGFLAYPTGARKCCLTPGWGGGVGWGE